MLSQLASKSFGLQISKKSINAVYVAGLQATSTFKRFEGRDGNGLGILQASFTCAATRGSLTFGRNTHSYAAHSYLKSSNDFSKRCGCFNGVFYQPKLLYSGGDGEHLKLSSRVLGLDVACFSLCSKTNQENKSVSNHQVENERKGGGDGKDEKPKGALGKFKNLMKMFMAGCKQLLWIDARKAFATKKKLKRHDYDLTILTREELRHMRQTRKDMIKSLPVALLFFIPFLGYFAPILGFLFPKRLLSQQFWDIEQRKKFAFEDHIKRSQYYVPLIQQVGWSCRELKNQEFFRLCIRALDGNHIANEDLLSFKDVFYEDLMTVEKMPKFHLQKLCKTWLLPVKWYVPSKVLREFLAYRIKQIIEDDDAIRREGMNALSDICIRQACHARGLDKSSFDIEVMKQWLEDWMHLTQKVTDANLSFVAHCAVFKTINFAMHVGKTQDASEENTG